jgi:hypothetical protein
MNDVAVSSSSGRARRRLRARGLGVASAIVAAALSVPAFAAGPALADTLPNGPTIQIASFNLVMPGFAQGSGAGAARHERVRRLARGALHKIKH